MIIQYFPRWKEPTLKNNKSLEHQLRLARHMLCPQEHDIAFFSLSSCNPLNLKEQDEEMSHRQHRCLPAFSEQEPSCFCYECIYYTHVLGHFSSTMKGEKVAQVMGLSSMLGAQARSHHPSITPPASPHHPELVTPSLHSLCYLF